METIKKVNSEFENTIFDLTLPINGQYPRPWFTNMSNPELADVFIVGRNQATVYSIDRITHEKHLNSLFNRNNESCVKEYQMFRGEKPSKTRENIKNFTNVLNRYNIFNILETDIICYSSPMSSVLQSREHKQGKIKGLEIFTYILNYIKPKIIFCYGSGTIKDFRKYFRIVLPEISLTMTELKNIKVDNSVYYSMPSLAPPAWNLWHSEANKYFEYIAESASKILRKKEI